MKQYDVTTRQFVLVAEGRGTCGDCYLPIAVGEAFRWKKKGRVTYPAHVKCPNGLSENSPITISK